jgi:hypothetical protein
MSVNDDAITFDRNQIQMVSDALADAGKEQIAKAISYYADSLVYAAKYTDLSALAMQANDLLAGR